MPRVTITVPEKTPQPYRFQLDRQSVSLGRGSENDIAIDSGSVSVKHAEMVRVDGGYELRDAGSTNGIKLDGERRDVIALRTGLSVKLGDVAFDFVLSDEEVEALGREKPAGESPIQKETEDGAIDLPPSRAASRKPVMVHDTGGGGFGMILLFLILAAAAFVAGLAVRFQKETGNSLLDAVKAKSEVSAPAKPGPAAPAPAPAPAAPATE
ncbi:MAG: FHA domain-containing protein [Akkermansiaceae bacterium]|nr:FHA domain-containing protein [Akkermansiaceae bacterium]